MLRSIILYFLYIIFIYLFKISFANLNRAVLYRAMGNASSARTTIL